MEINIKLAKISTSFKTEKIPPVLENLEVTPSTEEQNFKSKKDGFNNVLVKKVTASIDPNILPENIKEGTSILGVDGGYSGIDTSDATATAGDLLKDKTAYIGEGKITGTIEEYDGSFSGGGSTVSELETSYLSRIDGTNGVNITKLPSGITELGDYAFSRCTNLVSLELPNTITKIGDNAFERCTNLKSLILPNNITSLGMYVFSICSNLILTELPESITEIGAFCFNECPKLALTEIPRGVTTINNNVFNSCTNLTTITCLGDITNIGTYGFGRCSKLATLSLPNITSVPTLLGTNAFYNTPIASGTGYIYVPDNLVESFETANKWSTYANQIKPISEMEE